MKKPMIQILLSAMLLLGIPAFAAPVLTLDPATPLVGAPGTTVGWGFTLTNTTNYIVVYQVSFLTNPAPNTFADLLGPQFLVLGGANTSVTQAYDPINSLGLGTYSIAPATPTGLITGQLGYSYDEYSSDPNDPNFDPDASFLASNTLFVNATVNVQNRTPEVPEPSTWALALTGLAAAVALQRRR